MKEFFDGVFVFFGCAMVGLFVCYGIALACGMVSIARKCPEKMDEFISKIDN
jgi:hypothetical protein